MWFSRKNYEWNLCKICEERPVGKKWKNSLGAQIYMSVYNRCYNRPYVIYKKDCCEQCWFVPLHKCQLDVDHTDWNHHNNSINNLRTLCANCHRIKTFLEQKWSRYLKE
jgi:hypothetical protein